VRGPVALVSAGWQERELDQGELLAELGGLEIVNLGLWGRRESVRAADATFAAAADELVAGIEEARRFYRRRLDHVVEALRELMAETGDPRLLEPERRSALTALQELDRHFVARLRELRADGEAGGEGRPALRHERRAVAALASRCDAVLLAGGHVVELLDCLRLFAVADLFADRIVLAWSAGAMALTPLVVGFHDSPPQGAGNAEVLDEGLGACRGLVVLPHARRRLDTSDRQRVALMARRFAPAHCVALDGGEWLEGDGDRWRCPAGMRRLGQDGGISVVTSLDGARP
jgi:hypothetical protein